MGIKGLSTPSIPHTYHPGVTTLFPSTKSGSDHHRRNLATVSETTGTALTELYLPEPTPSSSPVMVEELDPTMVEELDQLLLSPSVDTDGPTANPTADHPAAATIVGTGRRADIFGRSLSSEIDRLFPTSIVSSSSPPSPPPPGHLSVPVLSSPPRRGSSLAHNGQNGAFPASAAGPTTAGTPTLDFDSLWASSQIGSTMDTMGSNAVDMLFPSAAAASSSGAAAGPAVSTTATPDASSRSGSDGSAGSATHMESKAAGWIVPYDPEAAAAAAAAAGNPGRGVAVAGPAHVIDPYTEGQALVFDPETAVNWAQQATKALEWVGPTGAHEFDAWEAKAKQQAINRPPTSMETITDEQLAYADLKVIMELARRAKYTPADLEDMKKKRRKCKNRLSAKGSASKRRVQMSSIAEVNKKLCAVVVGLRTQNETLARANAQLEVAVRERAEEQARADEHRDRFQAEIARLTEMVKTAQLDQQRATIHGGAGQHQPVVTSA